jgi:hypothetical protein
MSALKNARPLLSVSVPPGQFASLYERVRMHSMQLHGIEKCISHTYIVFRP